MTRYMLDTNTVSQLLKGHPDVARRVVAAPISALCISVITQAELLFGLARRPDARTLHTVVHEFLRRVDILAWNSDAAQAYANARAATQSAGRPLAPMDLLIGAHALAVNAVLVTNDHAFAQLAGLSVEDWTAVSR